MAVRTAAGTEVYIGGVRSAATDTLAEYKALTGWVLVGEVQSIGEFGDVASSVTFLSVGDARTRKIKGSRDAGEIALVCGRDPLDPGQVALRAAAKTDFEYAFKIVANDARDANDTDSLFFFGGLVMSAPDNYGGADDIVTSTFNIGINTPVFEEASTVVP